jgi:hypothetical protein
MKDQFDLAKILSPILDMNWSYEKTASDIRLSEKDFEAIIETFRVEVNRRLPDFCNVMLIVSALPILTERARQGFAKELDDEDAKELSQDFACKLLKAFFGNWPHGNSGAYLATMQKNIKNDWFRERERKSLAMQRLLNAFQSMY